MFEQKMNDQMQDLALLDRKKLEPWVPSGFADIMGKRLAITNQRRIGVFINGYLRWRTQENLIHLQPQRSMFNSR